MDEDVYGGLYAVVGRGNISQFIESLVRPLVTTDTLAADYEAMAADEERDREAGEWTEARFGDIGDETR